MTHHTQRDLPGVRQSIGVPVRTRGDSKPGESIDSAGGLDERPCHYWHFGPDNMQSGRCRTTGRIEDSGIDIGGAPDVSQRYAFSEAHASAHCKLEQTDVQRWPRNMRRCRCHTGNYLARPPLREPLLKQAFNSNRAWIYAQFHQQRNQLRRDRLHPARVRWRGQPVSPNLDIQMHPSRVQCRDKTDRTCAKDKYTRLAFQHRESRETGSGRRIWLIDRCEFASRRRFEQNKEAVACYCLCEGIQTTYSDHARAGSIDLGGSEEPTSAIAVA